MAKEIDKKNKFMFSFGTFGRDMVYTLVNMFLMTYIRELGVSDGVMLSVGIIIVVVGIFDACNDPIMGLIVDNTKSRWGKFKPWIVLGAILSAVFTVVLFSDIFGRDVWFVICFAVFYLLWTIAWTLNDISYWSMMPSLSSDSGDREVTSSLARIFASLGAFLAVVAVIPVTVALSEKYGTAGGYTIFAVGVVLIMLFTQAFTVFGVKELPDIVQIHEEKTSLKGMIRAIVKNDQLLICGLAMIPFSIGTVTTVSLAEAYFKYYYGDASMFSALAVVMGVASILSIACFPILCKIFKRKQLFGISTALLAVGYIIFLLSPPNILVIGIGATLLFIGQSLIQVTMLVCLADIVEYGEYKLAKRNESVTFSVQAFISKIGGAVASLVVSITFVISGINAVENNSTAVAISEQGIWILKFVMFVVPLLLILFGALIVLFKYKIDEDFYAEIITELDRRRTAKINEITRGEIVMDDEVSSD